ncbi:recombinase family protein [Actinocorallia longicatena]|uniref:Resolvase/invertase-type recombinase catalytic domain-containing protein n=1 Tax=Actinocorallia longicatena TaxID=111803 RepID=A0ABP6QGQ3_9ACTN
MPPQQRWTRDNLTLARLAIYLRASDDDAKTETSITAQGGVGRSWAEGVGITNVTVYSDNDLSASLFATKPREDFERLVRDIEAGAVDLIWFWKLNRSQRTLDTYVKLRDLCRAKGVGWVIKSRLYDLNSPEDLRTLGMDAVNSEIFSLELAENVRLGTHLAAAQGKPHGPGTYGYRRIYDARGRYVEQVPDDELREGDGFWWSPAGIVIEVVERVAKGDGISAITRDLTARGIPTPSGKSTTWARSVVRGLATNLAYIGTRVHEPEHGERTETPDAWPPIVGSTPGSDTRERWAETFWKAQAILGAPGRSSTKPGRGVHLCSYLAKCDDCESTVAAKQDRKRQRKGLGGEGRRMYACAPNRCVGIGADELDDFVRKVVDGYLARADVQEHLASLRSDDLAAVTARAEVAKLRGEIEKWRKLGEEGEDAVTVLRSVKALTAKADELEREAAAASSGLLLRDGRIDWSDLGAARQALADLVEIRVKAVGKGRRHVPTQERVSLRWLIGPGIG